MIRREYASIKLTVDIITVDEIHEKKIKIRNKKILTCRASRKSPTLSFVEKLKFANCTSFISFRNIY